MATAWRKLGKILAAGLAYSARTTALHEGMSWDSGARFLESTGGGIGSGHQGRLSGSQGGKKAPAP